jgi:hypothetical protein
MVNKLLMLSLYSNYTIAKKNAKIYLGNHVKLLVSTRANKKFMILDTTNGKYSHFGQMGYEDYTLHQDDLRRSRYLKRATGIKGDWHQNKYSPNNLSINILWQ